MIMKIILSIFISFILGNNAYSQNIDIELQKELLVIHKNDQKYRGNLNRYLQNPVLIDSLSKSLGVSKQNLGQALWAEQMKLDSLNLQRVTEIIRKRGYPGRSLVGDEASSAAFFVLQHAPADILEKYNPYIQKAAGQGDLPKRHAAMMQDRLLMYKGNEQIYGTQVRRFQLNDGSRLSVVWPVKDPDKVNELRQEAGFDLTVEENAKRLGVDYKLYTIRELEKITGEKLSN
jgi:hypothetical protein